MRHYNWLLRVYDAALLVETIGGESMVSDDTQTNDQICKNIIAGLPQHLRRPGFTHAIDLYQK